MKSRPAFLITPALENVGGCAQHRRRMGRRDEGFLGEIGDFSEKTGAGLVRPPGGLHGHGRLSCSSKPIRPIAHAVPAALVRLAPLAWLLTKGKRDCV